MLAWFKLGPIEEHDLDTRKYSYVRVDAFFRSQPSKYTVFYDKRIFSAQELTQQNRTIWFIREARSTDKDHEVSLLGASSLSPEHDVVRDAELRRQARTVRPDFTIQSFSELLSLLG